MSTSLPSIVLDERKLHDLFAEWDRDDQPGLVVEVRVADGRSWQRAYGISSIELPVPLATATRTRVGSTTKWIMSLAIHLLFEDGILTPQTRLKEIFPQFP